MTAEPWPCDQCGERGVRNVGSQGYCAVHLTELYLSFDQAVFGLNGIGLLDGAMRPDHAPNYADLRCVACGATWVGVVGDRCYWCAEAFTRMLDDQRTILLTPPDVEPDDRNYERIVTAWAERLGRGVIAGIVDDQTAQRALDRQLAA